MNIIEELEYVRDELKAMSLCDALNEDGLKNYSKFLYKIMKKVLKEIQKNDKNSVS